jgi:hypothetical protein
MLFVAMVTYAVFFQAIFALTVHSHGELICSSSECMKVSFENYSW